MSTALLDHKVQAGAGNGGVPARRAVIRWAWRMFRREWRQQMLVLALIVVALAATVVGAAVATNTPPPAGAGFGTAHDMATFQPAGPKPAGQKPGSQLASQIAATSADRTAMVAAYMIHAVAGAAPLNGTWSMSQPVIDLKSSPDR